MSVEIGNQVRQICELLGLNTNDVRRLDIYPATLVAEIYRTNAAGKKYIDPETAEVVVETQTFKISTHTAEAT